MICTLLHHLLDNIQLKRLVANRTLKASPDKSVPENNDPAGQADTLIQCISQQYNGMAFSGHIPDQIIYLLLGADINASCGMV